MGLQSPSMLRALGKSFAQVDAALQGFEHPTMHRHDVWDIRNAAETIRQRLLPSPHER